MSVMTLGAMVRPPVCIARAGGTVDTSDGTGCERPDMPSSEVMREGNVSVSHSMPAAPLTLPLSLIHI